jgi:hypothetical protein
MQTEKKRVHIDNLDREVEVRELTVSDMRALIRARQHIEDDFDFVSILPTDDGVLLSDLPYLTDLTAKDIGALTESEIGAILAASKRLNPRFFAQILPPMERMAEVLEKIPEMLPTLLESSSGTFSSSSEPDTETPGATR